MQIIHNCGYLAAAALLGAAGSATGQIFDFTVTPGQSGLAGTMSLTVPSEGTLVGNWDPATNPGGTRTKPGLFGTFGPTENVPVATGVTTTVGGPLNTSTSGALRLTMDPGSGIAEVTGYTSNFLAGGPASLPVTLTLLYESFRTRSPDSTYPGGVPLPIPFGEATLTQLSLVQLGGGMGTLVATGPGHYDFAAAPIVQLMAEFTVLGTPVTVPGAPVAFPIEGQVVVDGLTAVLTSVRALELTEQMAINQALPQLAFDLPTVLPPGATSHLLMNQTVGTVAAELMGTSTIHATGILIPAPGAAIALCLSSLALVRRRR